MKAKKKMQAGGVAPQSNPKAPDKKGAFIAVQKKTLAQKAKCGKKVKKGK